MARRAARDAHRGTLDADTEAAAGAARRTSAPSTSSSCRRPRRGRSSRRASAPSTWPRPRVPTTSSTSSCRARRSRTTSRPSPRSPTPTARSSPAAGTWATATCTCRCTCPTQIARTALLDELFAAGVATGGQVSGEHGIGLDKQRPFLALTDPVAALAPATDQGGVRPDGAPQPRQAAGRREAEMNGAVSLLATLAANDVTTCFMNPGTSEMHFVAALDDVPERPRRAVPLRGRRLGGRRRLRAGGRHARRDAAAPRPRARQRLREPPQRAARALADPQRRGRPRDVPRALRRPAADRRRLARRARWRAGTGAARAPTTSPATPPRRSPQPWAHPDAIATLVLPADASWSEPTADRPAPIALRRAPARVGPDDGRPSRRARCAPRARRSCSGARRCAAAASPPPRASRTRRAAGCCTRPSPPSWIAARGVLAPERLNYLGELALAAARRGRACSCSRAPPRPVSFFAYPSLPSSPRPRGLRGRRRSPGSTSTCPVPSRRSPSAVDAPASVEAPPAAPPSRLAAPTGPLTAGAFCAAVGRAAARGLRRRGRVQHLGRRALRRDAGAPAPRVAHAHRRRDRLRAARRSGRGDRRRGPPRVVPRVRRVDELHAPGPLDDGPRGARRDGRVLLERQLRDLELRARPRRRDGERRARPRDARPHRRRRSDLAATAEGYGVPASTATTADELVVELEKALATEGPTFINARLTRG